MDSANTRSAHPGLSSFDFEQTLHITTNHLTGWDTSSKENKVGEGIFGDVDGCCHAVEEQSRKTLHAHFLIWLTGWTSVLDGLRNVLQRDTHIEQVKRHSGLMKCNTQHGNQKLNCACKRGRNVDLF